MLSSTETYFIIPPKTYAKLLTLHLSYEQSYCDMIIKQVITLGTFIFHQYF